MMIKSGLTACLLAFGVLLGSARATPAYTGTLIENMKAYLAATGDKAEISLSPDLVFHGTTENGRVVLGKMPEEIIEYTLQQWSVASMSRLEASSFKDMELFPKLVVLAFKMKGCEEFEVATVERLPLHQMAIRTADGEATISPQVYSEQWGVNACGKLRRWHIYDADGQAKFVEVLGP